MNERVQAITAKVGDIIEIPLKTNASTGFRWEIFLCEEPIIFSILETKWEKIPGLARAPGGPSIQTFRLKALSKGETKIAFHHRRPWKKDIREEKIILLKVH
jgi:predicted secreted protein